MLMNIYTVEKVGKAMIEDELRRQDRRHRVEEALKAHADEQHAIANTTERRRFIHRLVFRLFRARAAGIPG